MPMHKYGPQILPELVSTADARRRAAEKAAAYEALPSKRSGRLHVLQKKKEEEDAARKVGFVCPTRSVGHCMGRPL